MKHLEVPELFLYLKLHEPFWPPRSTVFVDRARGSQAGYGDDVLF